MLTEDEMIAQLASAQRRGVHDVHGSLFVDLSREAAYRVQAGVRTALGATPALLKTAIHPDGVGVVAPIFVFGQGGAFTLPEANVVGLEVEVGVVLRHDVPSGADEATVRAAIDHYFTGVEICGSRFLDRTLAGLNGALADNMSALAYCRAPGPRGAGADIAGVDIALSFAGTEIFNGPAKHGFGDVHASLLAYARGQHPDYPLRAGTIVTTGSMCGLVPTSGPGHVVARLGDESVEFDIV